MTDSSGVAGTAPVEQITVIRGSGSGPAVDRTVIATGSGTVATARFSTPPGRQTLLALVGSDGPAQSNGQAVTVTGAGLRWRLVKRENHQDGDAEIWTASAARQLHDAVVTSRPNDSGYDQQLTVLAISDSSGRRGSGESVSRDWRANRQPDC